jgi:hypothetical protein
MSPFWRSLGVHCEGGGLIELMLEGHPGALGPGGVGNSKTVKTSLAKVDGFSLSIPVTLKRTFDEAPSTRFCGYGNTELLSGTTVSVFCTTGTKASDPDKLS